MSSAETITGARSLFRFSVCLMLSFPALAGAQSQPVIQGLVSRVSGEPGTGASGGWQWPGQQLLGTVSGTIVDQSASIVIGARIRLTRGDHSADQEVVSDESGQFSFANLAPGTFQLTITSTGLATLVVSGTVHEGEALTVPQIVLAVATQLTQVTVGLTPVEQAQVQIQDQEKQRVLGIIPNFYVSYVPDAITLTPKQKIELAWKSSTDPFTFLAIGAVAGIQQATDAFPGYGQGAQGYARRYGASYGDVAIGTFLGSAVLPSLLKQDPRYFYKGTGSARSRLLYALSSPIICKGDNGYWQANYSYILGSLAAGGIATFYRPPGGHNGAGWVVETTLIRMGENAVASVFQEFIVPKLTPNLHNRAPSQP